MLKALTLAFVIAATLAVTNAQQPIAIGIVRDDGLLMPIAQLTGAVYAEPSFPTQTFINGEPMGDKAPSVPGAQLHHLEWTLAQRNNPPVSIRTAGTVSAWMPYCNERILLRTTLQRPPLDRGYAPVRKLGLAVSGAAVIFPEEVSTLPDQASRRVAEQIVVMFLAKETARLSGENGPHAAIMAPGAPPVTLRLLERHTIGTASTYYFEATKPLKLSDGAIMPDAGLLTGWIVDAKDGLKDYEVTYKINDDTYKENARAVVRGIVIHQDSALWLLEWHGWESEYFTIHEWPAGVVHPAVGAYEC